MSFFSILSEKLKAGPSPAPTNLDTGGGFLGSLSRTLKEFPGALMEEDAKFVDRAGTIGDFLLDVAQGVARTIATVGTEAGNLPFKAGNKITGSNYLPFDKEIPTSGTKVGEIVFGGKPVRDIAGTAEATLVGWDEFRDSLNGEKGVTPTTRTFLNKGLAVGATVFGDLSGTGGAAKKISQKAVVKSFELMAKSKKPTEIVPETINLFRKLGLKIFGRKEANEIAPKIVDSLTKEDVARTVGDYLDTKLPAKETAGAVDNVVKDLDTPVQKAIKDGLTVEQYVKGQVKEQLSATQYGDYKPELRKFGAEDYTPIIKLGVKPDEMVTIYRGIDDIKGNLPRKINNGDFVTTDFDSALSYAGSPEDVVSMKVKAKYLSVSEAGDFKADPFYTGSEYIYTKEIINPKTSSQLRTEYAEELAKSKGAVDKTLPPGTKPSGFATTVAESTKTAPEIATGVKDLTYKTINNTDTLAKADARIAANADDALAYVRNTPEPDAETYATGMQLITKYQNEGNYQQAIDIIRDMAPKATKQGQAIQVLSMYNRLTPEGILKYAVNEADKAKVGKKITKEFSDDIVKDATRIQKLPEGPDKLFETAKMIKKIDDLLPVGLGRKISTIQTMFQLLNPKTIGRNIIGNAGFAAFENVADVPAAIFDSALSVFTKTRTKGMPSIGAQSKGFMDGLKIGIKDAMTGVDTTFGSVTSQFELYGRTFKSGFMEKAEKTLNVVLKGPDRAFYTAARDGSLASQLRAKGFKSLDDVPANLLNEMKEAAHLDGLYRTFQDDSALAGMFTGLKKALNLPTTKAFGQGSIGLGDFVLKYPKTPANLLSRGLAYSPVGFANTLIEMVRPMVGGKFNQKKFVESFGRALTGSTMLVGLGAMMHKIGLITGKREDNININAVENREGLGQYKINASALKRFVMSGFDPEQAQLQKGDNLASYDWFQPNSIGLSIGANYDQGGGDGATMLGSILSGLDTLAEQPLIQGVTRFTKSRNLSEGFTKLIESAPSSFVPTLVNQIRQVVDPTARSIQDTNFMGRMSRSVQNRIPGLSDNLEPRVNVFGENQKVYQAGDNNFFNVFFNPAFITKFKGTPEGQLVLDLYKDTGLAGQAPKIAQKSYIINGEKKPLTPEEFTGYQRFIGTYSKEIIGSLSQSPEFKSAPQDEQIKAISNVLSDIGSAGRIIILGNRPEKVPSKGVQVIMQRHLQLYGAR